MTDTIAQVKYDTADHVAVKVAAEAFAVNTTLKDPRFAQYQLVGQFYIDNPEINLPDELPEPIVVREDGRSITWAIMFDVTGWDGVAATVRLQASFPKSYVLQIVHPH